MMPTRKHGAGRAALAATTALAGLAWLAAAPWANAAQTAAAGQAAAPVETLIVTAQKRSENIQDVPISIQAFSAKDIKVLGIKSSIDVGAVTPNVDIALVAGPGNQPIITIRGIGLNDYDTNNAGPNGVYVDEVYLSSPSSQTFQAFDLERIEVLKGPQGTLYGRNTSGGAINFVANKPTNQPSLDLHAEYSSFNTFNFAGALSGPIAPGLTGRIAFVKNNSSGFFHNDLTNTSENGTDNYAVRVQLQYKPTSDLTLLFNVHGGQVDNRVTEYRHIGDFVPGTQGSPAPTQCSIAASYAGGCVDLFGYGTPKNFYEGSFNRRQHLKVNSLGASFRADYALGPITLTSLSAFEHNDKIHPEDSDASPNRLLEINFGVRSNTFTQEFRASHSSAKFNWVGGLYYLHEDLKQNQPIFLFLDFDKFGGFGIPPGPGAGDDNGTALQAFDRSIQITKAYAAFGQADYALTERLKLTLGGRYTTERRSFHYDGSVQLQSGGTDHFGPLQQLALTDESLSNSAFNYRAALDFKLTRDVLAYASIASGYKSGGFNGSFLSLNPAEIAVQLTPVRPEHVTSYEVGLKSTLFEGRLIFDAAAFYNTYRDLQVFTLVQSPPGGGGLPINVLDNAPRAHTEGVEAQLVARPVPALTASLQVGLLNTKLDQFLQSKSTSPLDLSGNQLPISPHFSLAGLVDYKVPVAGGALDLQFSASYKSHQFFDTVNDPYITQDGYWLENIRVAYGPAGGRWEVAAYVRNLSDRQYYLDKFDLTSPFGFIQGIVGTPRTFGGEVNFHF